MPDVLVSLLHCSGWRVASPPPLPPVQCVARLNPTQTEGRRDIDWFGPSQTRCCCAATLTDTTRCNLLSWIRCGLLRPEKYARKLWEERLVTLRGKAGLCSATAGSSCESAGGGREGLLLLGCQLQSWAGHGNY